MTHPLDIAIAQRDSARRLAVALEQQVALYERDVAELMDALDEAQSVDPWPEAAAAQAAINARGTTHIPTTDPPF